VRYVWRSNLYLNWRRCSTNKTITRRRKTICSWASTRHLPRSSSPTPAPISTTWQVRANPCSKWCSSADVPLLLFSRHERERNAQTQSQQLLQGKGPEAQTQSTTSLIQAGFYDAGASATIEELLKALNKALASADPQQASVILSHILEKKNLSESERNKFAVMKCKILFG
jgi:hypothetical protein